MILCVQRDLSDDGVTVRLSQLCHWFGVVRRTVYHQTVKTVPKVHPRDAEPVKTMI